jgi:hypothetical protein
MHTIIENCDSSSHSQLDKKQGNYDSSSLHSQLNKKQGNYDSSSLV